MYGYFHDKQYIYVVLEYADNGSIFKKLVQEKSFGEALIAKVFLQSEKSNFFNFKKVPVSIN